MTIKQCPLKSTYLFTSACTINSCKLYTLVTDNNCLMLDNVISDENITDEQLLQYKFSDTDLTEKDVIALRKKAVDRVKNIVTLYRLISQVAEHKATSPKYKLTNHAIIDKVLTSKPLSISKLGFESWMFARLVDEKYVESVCVPKFKIKTALFLTQKEYVELVNVVNSNTLN